jgi:hypothetical protein
MQALHVYATTTLHLAPIDAAVADSRVEATELVDTLFDKGLQGKLPFDLPEDATEEQVVRYLSNRLRWMCTDTFRQDARTVGDEALDELPDPTPDALERLSGLRMVDGCKRALQHDAEASAYLEQFGDKPRAGIAAALGWTVQRVKVVRNRIARTLAALTARDADMDDDGEDEPPSSGPRGDYDVPTAEERRRAPPEPHRWAGGARRRR